MMLAALLQASPSGDFWDKLLGIDRVRMEGDKSIAWHHMPPAWVLFLIIIPAVAILVYAVYRRERRDVGAGPKVVLTALRALLLLLVLLMLMGPVLTVETEKMRKAYVVVLVDESRSMKKGDLLQKDEERRALADATGVAGEVELRKLTRADIVKGILTNPRLQLLEQLEEKLNVEYFTFSNTASQKGTNAEGRKKFLENYDPAACIGTETAIGDAVKAALNSLKGQIVVGVVLLSDGRNNSGMAPQEIAKQLKQRYLPLYTVPAGIPHVPKDIALMELEAPRDAIIANDEMKVTLKVHSFGYDKEKVDVGLWSYPIKDKDKDLPHLPQDLDRLIEESRKEVDLGVELENNQKQSQTLKFQPKTPGEYLLILRVNPRADENTAHNNYLTHRLRVADDKIKVLYVEHPPRYEYRFLKNALIRDPKILAHCFLTSADEGFPQEHTKAEDRLFQQPLQEFPKDLKSLLEFDVIIYGDVEPGKLGPDAAKHIETFVSEFGGGIIFISGMERNPRLLVNTPLANLLPIVPEESRDPFQSDKIYSQMYGYYLTPDGKTSPVTRFKDFGNDKEKNLEHWEDRDGHGDGLVGVRWFQPVRKLKAGASPLVELTGVAGESGRPPLFVTQHVGRGRVFWSATDETWLWRYLIGDYPWFYPFWQQSMYWVREGKLLGARRYRVSVDKERYTRGQPVQIYANAYDEKFDPKTDDKITVFVDPPAGERISVTLDRDPTRAGYYEGKFSPTDTGQYKLWAGEEDESSRASTRFIVFIPDREDDDPILDEDTLKQLAADSAGGRFFPIGEVAKLPEALKESKMVLTETKEDELWDSPLVFLIFAFLITVEWILRKVFRML